ncbi:hypothetical protein [Noviherbaspirillum sp.]|uniref:hypothetical protein n=1 Tax=Noviherbaspirillum sp. TaxID=1926288 RepID=UPI002FE17DF1
MTINRSTRFKPAAFALCAMCLVACGSGSSGAAMQTAASAAPARTEAQISAEMQTVWISFAQHLFNGDATGD